MTVIWTHWLHSTTVRSKKCLISLSRGLGGMHPGKAHTTQFLISKIGARSQLTLRVEGSTRWPLNLPFSSRRKGHSSSQRLDRRGSFQSSNSCSLRLVLKSIRIITSLTWIVWVDKMLIGSTKNPLTRLISFCQVNKVSTVMFIKKHIPHLEQALRWKRPAPPTSTNKNRVLK